MVLLFIVLVLRFVFQSSMFLNSVAQLDIDPHAPTESQAHVLLGAVPQLSGAQNVFPRHQVQ